MSVYVILAIAFAGTVAGTALMIRRGHMDIPNERSSHSRPVAVGGGLPMVVMITLGMLYWGWSRQALGDWLPWMGCGIVIALVSWMDDLKPVPSIVRLAIHTAAAVVILLTCPGFEVMIPLAYVIGFIWIVGMTNAFNFMDGIDGIAGGQALVAGLGYAYFGWELGLPGTALFGGLIAVASLGFLLFNCPPAKIFMGDVGSAYLGFTLAVIPWITASRGGIALLGVCSLLVWPFLFDTSFTMGRRLLRRENVLAAHRSHLYQRMVIAGKSHIHVSILYTGCALAGLAAAVMMRHGVFWGLGLIPILASLLWLYTVHLEKKTCV